MDVGIIGAGASGMMAAVTAASNGNRVTVFEKNSKAGKKLLSTGNGKCNFTNRNIDAGCYNDNSMDLFESVYNEFDIESTITFFEKIGITSYEKNGYLYPRSEQASSVVECLSAELNRNKVNVIYDCKVVSIEYKTKFYVYTDKECYSFDKLIIAAGSNAAPKTGSDGSGYGYAIKLGHTVKKPLPALCGLKCKGTDFKSISGVRCQAKVTLTSDGEIIRSDSGELQLTEYGVSGIPVFQISGDALRLLDDGHSVAVRVDYANEYTFDDLLKYIKEKRLNLTMGTSLNTCLEGFINNKLADRFVKDSMIYDNSKAEEGIDCYKLAKLLKESEYMVTGHRGFDNCQVCSGGVLCTEVNDNLESKLIKGLYFAGEILDVNGICGGYNLQWAWSSGYVAGRLL